MISIKKGWYNKTVPDPNDPTGIRQIVDTDKQYAMFTLEVSKVYHFGNDFKDDIDKEAREYILKDLLKQIENELEKGDIER